MNTKRLGIASALGVVCGIICLLLGHFAGGAEVTILFVGGGLFNRTLMGFVIGSTAFKGNPFLRGPAMGLLMSIGPALPMPVGNAIPYLVAGTLYGLLIDSVTSKVFKADN